MFFCVFIGVFLGYTGSCGVFGVFGALGGWFWVLSCVIGDFGCFLGVILGF